MKKLILKLTAGVALGLACFTLSVDHLSPQDLEVGPADALAFSELKIPAPILCLGDKFFETVCSGIGIGCNAVSCSDLEDPPKIM